MLFMQQMKEFSSHLNKTQSCGETAACKLCLCSDVFIVELTTTANESASDPRGTEQSFTYKRKRQKRDAEIYYASKTCGMTPGPPFEIDLWGDEFF